MKGFWSRVESCWDKSKTIAWIAVAFGVVLVMWATWKPRSPGISIGLLALAAGFISIRPKMHFMERVAWVAILIALTCLEVQAIKRNDQENADIRNSQNKAFGLIVDDLKISIQNSKDQYKQTVDHVDKVSGDVDRVAKTTQKVAEVAHSNLLAVTGGDSYAYVYPTAVGSDQIQLKVHNDGDQPLDLRVTIMEVTSGFDCNQISRGHLVYTIGPLAPHEGRMIQNAIITPALRPDGTAQYRIFINAQNHGVSENLYLRRVTGNPYLEYKLSASRPVTGKKRLGSDVNLCGVLIRWLKKKDWTTTLNQSAAEDPATLK